MSDHKARELEHDTAPKHPKGRKETFAERDPLAAEEPTVLESSADDPEFPAMQEFEVDEGGPKANTRKHPGLICAIIAIVAVIALCIAFAAAGDWMNPTQAEKVQQTEFEEQTVPEDLEPRGSLNRASTPPPPSAISCDGYITCAPKGKSDSFAILRHWRPMGIPMTVMQ